MSTATETTPEPRTRIVRLQAENFKKLTAIDITPQGNVVVIGGDNGAGKSSVLDAVACLFGGKTELPAVAVKTGTEKATIIADLGDIVVTRTITKAGGGTLTIKNKEGATFGSPQAMLDKLLGKLTFDPLAFNRLDDKPQAEALRKLVGIDFTAHDAERARVYSERTFVNRDVERLTGHAESLPHYPDAPAMPVSVTDLNRELEEARAKNRENTAARAKLDDWRLGCRERAQEIAGIDQEIKVLEERLSKLRADRTDAVAQLSSCDEKTAAFALEVAKLVDIDTAPILVQIRDAESLNEQIQKNETRAGWFDQAKVKKVESEALTAKLVEMDAQKAATLASTPFPIKGLGFGETGVTFNDLPLSQASAAERLRVSVAIGAALNPKLRVMLVRDASLLDEKSFALLAELARERDLQVFLEMVGDNKHVQVLIEDGHVAETRDVGPVVPLPASAL